MKRISIFVVLITFIFSLSFSQDSDKSKFFKRVELDRAGLINFNYIMGFPVGDFKDFINKSSFRGFNFEYRHFLNDNMSVGGYIGWNGFYEETGRSTYTFDNGAITGVLYKYLYVLPIYANLHYYPFPGDPVQPFAGLAFGAIYLNKESQMGILSIPRIVIEAIYKRDDIEQFLLDGIDEEKAAKEECRKLSEAVQDDELSSFFDYINYQENYHIELMQKAIKVLKEK